MVRKNVVQDVVPGRRSIRDVAVPSRRREEPSTDSIRRVSREVPRENVRENTRTVDQTFESSREDVRDVKRVVRSDDIYSSTRNNTSTMPEKKVLSEDLTGRIPEYDFDYDTDKPHKEKKWAIWSLGLIFIIALVFGIISLFSSAKVTVVSKTQTINLQNAYTAPKDQPVGQFGYQTVSLSKTIQTDVPAGSEAKVNTKSTGTIIIYNKSNVVQNLVATTRFQTTAGLVFRIVQGVIVPGATTVSGKSVPGSVSAAVIADQPGESYNIPLSDFTLPGLKGTVHFADVYGRSKTAMTGGFSGMKKTVDQNTLASTTALMQDSLKADLVDQITTQLPKNFVYYPSSTSFDFSAPTQNDASTTGKTTVAVTGTATGVIFDRALLSQKIIDSLASSTAINGQANVQNLSDFKFTLTSPASITKDYTGPISFQLSGGAQVIWLFDENALKNDLLGIKKSDLNALLQAKYPAILKAEAKLFPVWNGSFPGNPAKITITQVDSF
jgi:hypothetical protein